MTLRRDRQHQTNHLSQLSPLTNLSPRFALSPVIEPKIQKKELEKPPNWKPQSTGKPNPLQRLRDTLTTLSNPQKLQRDISEEDLAQPLKTLDKFNKDQINVYRNILSEEPLKTIPRTKNFQIIKRETTDQFDRYQIKYYDWDSHEPDATERLKQQELYVDVADVDLGTTQQTQIDTDLHPILPPSADEIRHQDVYQEGVSDCYLQSALAAIASQAPQKILDMIEVNENTVTVRLYLHENQIPKFNSPANELIRTNIIVQKSLLIDRSGKLVYGGKLAPGTYLWPAFVQKAWAVVKKGYAQTAFGMAGNAMKAITGEGNYNEIQHGNDISFQWNLYNKIRNALQRNIPVSLGTTTFAKTGRWKKFLNNRKNRPGPADMPRGDVRVLHGYAVLGLNKMNLQENHFTRSWKNPILPTVKLTLRDPRDLSGRTFTRTLDDVVKHEKFQTVHVGENG